MCLGPHLHFSGGGKGAREGGRPRRHFVGAAIEGRKFGILAFGLQCVSVSIYLFLILFSALRMGVSVGAAAPRTFAPAKTLAAPLKNKLSAFVAVQ